jgi:ABC-type Mn2+/Zn2+ transport system permease subunit
MILVSLGFPVEIALLLCLFVTMFSVFSWMWISAMQYRAIRWSLCLGAMSGIAGAFVPTAGVIFLMMASGHAQMGGIIAMLLAGYFVGAIIYGMTFTTVMSMAFPFRSTYSDMHQEPGRSS